MNHDEKARLLIQAGSEALEGRLDAGERLIAESWPHMPRSRRKGSISQKQRIRAFLEDGCRCRYTGELLLLPPYMTALSVLWPNTFPAHRNGAAQFAHDAYWSHLASVDHRDPASLGGAHGSENLVTTSMARNQLRSRFSLEELGWSERPVPKDGHWDGGAGLLLRLVETYPHVLDDAKWGKYLRRFVADLRAVLSKHPALAVL